MKKIIHAGRSCRLLRPMTLEEAKALCLGLNESMAREHNWPERVSTPSDCAFTR